MLHKLPKTEYQKVEKLFEPLHYQLFCPAVIAGIQDGDIYVDDPETPHSAFMITRSNWGYLAGDPHNQGFNQALNEAIRSRSILDDQVWGLLLSCHPESWAPALKTVCAPKEPIRMTRLHYTATKMDFDWQSQIPSDYTIRPIEQDLLEIEEIPEDVKNLITTWDQIEDPANHGTGYVALHDGKIAAHAVIDCVVGKTGDMGLVTEPEHRQRGLATILSAASIERAFGNGLTKILWDAAEHNIPSIRTAEKLGLQFQEKHQMYLIDFDDVWHQVSLAVNRLDNGRYDEAIAICNQLIGQADEIPPLGYFVRATAFAAKGEAARAFELLNQAIDTGWVAINYTQNRKEWQPFHDRPEWHSALNRMKAT